MLSRRSHSWYRAVLPFIVAEFSQTKLWYYTLNLYPTHHIFIYQAFALILNSRALAIYIQCYVYLWYTVHWPRRVHYIHEWPCMKSAPPRPGLEPRSFPIAGTALPLCYLDGHTPHTGLYCLYIVAEFSQTKLWYYTLNLYPTYHICIYQAFALILNSRALAIYIQCYVYLRYTVHWPRRVHYIHEWPCMKSAPPRPGLEPRSFPIAGTALPLCYPGGHTPT